MNKTKNTLLLLLTAFIWGVAFVAQSVGMDYVGPLTFNASRFIIGAVFLLPCIAFLDKLKKKENPSAPSGPVSSSDKKHYLSAESAAASQLPLPARFSSLVSLPRPLAKPVLSRHYTLSWSLFSAFFLKKRPRAIIWVSVLLALAGLYFLCMTDSLSFSKGDTLVLISAACFSIHILIIDHFSPKVDGVRMSFIQFLIAGILCGIPALIFETRHFPHCPPPGHLSSMQVSSPAASLIHFRL